MSSEVNTFSRSVQFSQSKTIFCLLSSIKKKLWQCNEERLVVMGGIILIYAHIIEGFREDWSILYNVTDTLILVNVRSQMIRVNLSFPSDLLFHGYYNSLFPLSMCPHILFSLRFNIKS